MSKRRTNFQNMRQRLLRSAGVLEKETPKWTIQKLEHEWSDQFERLMRNRLMMGALRYGGLRTPSNPGATTDLNVNQMIQRTQRYIETGNAENLVDVANFALAEFVQQRHPKFHFESIDRK